MQLINIDHSPLSLVTLKHIIDGPVTLKVTEAVWQDVRKSREVVMNVIAEDKTVYGINTGFGILAKRSISHDQLEELQKNIILSHAAGVGEYLDDDTVRLILVLKLKALLRGHSGISETVANALIALVDHEVYPCIRAQGSVGASGDLAPLSYIGAVLLGEGEVRVNGEIMPAREGLNRAGLKPVTLGAKEGLALNNGTQVSTAICLKNYFVLEDLLLASMACGAMAIDASGGTDTPFDDRIHQARGQQGQIDVAAHYRSLLQGSALLESHRNQRGRVQDPYSLRCQPQVLGACLDQLRHAANILAAEANSVTDNPLIFADENEILSGGNFHAEPVAFAADNLALVAAEIGSLSERRLALLVDEHFSGLPAFLVPGNGVHSGFMIAQVTAAALVSENKQLSHPASVDSIPTSANQEDHVSMATHGARRLGKMADNLQKTLAIELLAVCQGIDLRAPLQSSKPLMQVLTCLRETVSFYEVDRFFDPDIEKAAQLLQKFAWRELSQEKLLPSQRE
ncbi:histidine ammonia-lyase [Piscirickettsia litoralis]|uniref:Histidine ammonia-lyase n=1 Tax=Piscirickettsia litoralis TaxID=1891921 RepID=A0ABX3A0G6_9GAMM|nr:histidine ammonia-lyase [Piscirickettsia litoralis]ODN42283.1 histidine ammonia-lyase [Piscirickettsia litoralis]